jgi:hypothetical protein
MRTPRFFIVLGACVVLFTIAHASVQSLTPPVDAGPLPIHWYDPRAGDPDEPGFWEAIEFDEEPSSGRTATRLEAHSSSTSSAGRPARIDTAILVGRLLRVHLFGWGIR